MHLYLRAIGLAGIDTRKKMDSLLKDIIKDATERGGIDIGERPISDKEKLYPAQIHCYMSDVSGISIYGHCNSSGKCFKMEYYFPFIDGTTVSTEPELSVGRRVDKNAYNAMCDAPGRGIAIIFFLNNSMDYLRHAAGRYDFNNMGVKLSALSNEGVILLPLNKSERQIRKHKAATAARMNLIEQAKKGDASAMDNLTIDDLDTYTSIFRRMRQEDVFSIVDTSFMPSGFECDAYSVVGLIMDVKEHTNKLTGENIYVLKVECNDIIVDIGINKNDLTGIPKVGRRFKGRIWLQGSVNFKC